MKNILVVGSINMDMVITVDRVPHMGETLSGDGFMTVPGENVEAVNNVYLEVQSSSFAQRVVIPILFVG